MLRIRCSFFRSSNACYPHKAGAREWGQSQEPLLRGGGGQGCIGPLRRSQRWLDRRLEEVAKAVGAVTIGYNCH